MVDAETVNGAFKNLKLQPQDDDSLAAESKGSLIYFLRKFSG